MTEFSERIGLTLTGLLLVVAGACVIGLWTLSTSTTSGESLFAVYLSADLVAFAIISYIYRVNKVGGDLDPAPLMAGFLTLAILVTTGLAVAI